MKLRAHIDLINHPRAANLMVSRGAPKAALLRAPFDLDSSNVKPALHSTCKPIAPMVQIRDFIAWQEAPTSGARWMVIGSQFDEDMAMSAALDVMLRATILHAENSLSQRPFLWPLYGGYNKLRNRDEFREGIGGIGLLILTNIAVNSTREKIESCRDLLHMFSKVPRIVVLAGGDPLQFALDELHARPNRVLHIGRGTQKASEKQI